MAEQLPVAPEMNDQLLIFDCDGVLVDSEYLEHVTDAEVLAPFGIRFTVAELIERFVGIARRDMYEVLFSELQRAIPDGLLEQREVLVWRRCQSDLKAIAGIDIALGELAGMPKCVASSSTPAKLQVKLAAVGFAHLFSPHIFSTALVNRGKPAPDIYLYAANIVGFPPEQCVVIEDSPHGVAGARRAQMRVIGFIGGSHANSSLAQQLYNAGAALVVSDAGNLTSAIRELSVRSAGKAG